MITKLSDVTDRKRWVAFIAFPNLRSFTRHGWLVLGKLDHFTAPAAGYRLHLCRKKISNVKFDYFRHNIVLFTRTSQSCLKSVALFDAVRPYGLTQRKPHRGVRGCCHNERTVSGTGKAECFLILFAESLGVGFAVRIEELLAALLPRHFQSAAPFKSAIDR
jgi:hypothetical protein